MRRATAFGLLVVAAIAAGPGCNGKEARPTDAGCDDGASCRDTDCDRICDRDEGFPDQDTDGDGTPDYLDSDSDGDGIDDRDEAGDTDLSTPPIDRNQNGIPDAVEAAYPLRAWIDDGSPDSTVAVMPPPQHTRDAAMMDGGTDARGEYTVDSGEVDVELCPDEDQVPLGCAASESDQCDGLDNDCDGQVDGAGSCGCARGAVRNCFVGPPGRRGVGACADGQQVCLGQEFTYWGPCRGGTGPSEEVCDGIDNDCNGCSDEVLACASKLTCPEPGDPRIIVAQPFVQYTLDAAQFYAGDDATGYRWEVTGSPCDVLFSTIDTNATASSGRLSYRLDQSTAAQAGVRFALSGDYQVRLTMTTPEGELGCNWAMPVRGPGVRVELCWPNTGPKAIDLGGHVDLDLHLARDPSTAAWGGNRDCFHQYCAGATSPWGFSESPLSNCQGSRNTLVYEVLGHCPNPRLDADNRLDGDSAASYITENINIDNPGTGDRLRVMVEHHDNSQHRAQGQPDPPVPVATEPLVNIYCGGVLKASYGGDPSVITGDTDAVDGLDTPGERWQVADIVVEGGGAATDCSVTPLSAPAPEIGYWIDDGTTDTVSW